MEIKLLTEASNLFEKIFIGWGLSFLVDNDVIFDTFNQPLMVKRGLDRNNIDIKKLKYAVISHDHWDHTGGLWFILKHNPEISVYVCKNVSDKLKEDIGKTGRTLIEVEEFRKIKENIFTTGEITGEYKGEPIYEQAMVVKNETGLTVVTGCSHPGILKILEKVRERFAEDIELLIGGLHLLDKEEKEIQNIILKLKEIGVKKVAPCHCTGKKAVNLLKEEFKENFYKIKEFK